MRGTSERLFTLRKLTDFDGVLRLVTSNSSSPRLQIKCETEMKTKEAANEKANETSNKEK